MNEAFSLTVTKTRLALLAFIFVAGCATTPQFATSQAPSTLKANVNLSGYPPAFQAGYADGCGSAGAARKRDETRFTTEALYAQGWRDGYDMCKSR